jgi:membrane associated rhomboid family serine protease
MAYRDSYGRAGGFGFGFALTPWVKRLLIANAAVFLLQWIAPLVLRYFAFVPSMVLLRPWSPVTYMFLHGGFWHLFFNMLGLFFFGPPLEQQWGSREFIRYYLICGLGGAALSFLFAFDSAVIGASAAVFGVMLAFAMLWPRAPIYIWGIFPVPAFILVGLFAVMSLVSAMGATRDGVAHFAHLGGFAAGFLYLRLADRAGQSLKGLKKKVDRRRLRVVEGRKDAGVGRQPPPRPLPRADEERVLDEVDRVLDKISREGLSSLTPEERRVLDEASRKYRRD